MLDAALRAPAAPDVEHVRRAEQVLGRHQPARFVQQRQGEVRRRPVDQRRGQGLAVAAAGLAYAVEQQREEGEEANGADDHGKARTAGGSEGTKSGLQSQMRISYAVFCLKKKKQTITDKKSK